MMPENQITTTTKVGEEILDTVLTKANIGHDIVSYSEASRAEQSRITPLVEQIHMDDHNSILFFGSDAQEDMSTISEEMLNGVKNKDLGNASKSLNDIVVAIKGFDIDELNPNKKASFLVGYLVKLSLLLHLSLNTMI